ncbi:MAG: hypothetical protein EHM64_11955 [Ignavibacteriae bacterium]|nr:MAG: hypothetical protein EHM64_11955 [Ignavibacteriota bacterium]
MNKSRISLEQELTALYGEAQRPRLQQGLKQIAEFWRPDDGLAEVFEEFVRKNFAGDQATLDVMFHRYEYLLEQLNGHLTEINREFRQQSDLDLGKIYPFDETFAGYAPGAHITDDFFQNKLAFIILLNFPLTTLHERLTEGGGWSRRQWAEVRLAQQFAKRIPAEVNLSVSRISSEAEQYISQYNIYMHHLINNNGVRLFPPKLRLLAHWNLRDELKANYNEGKTGFAKQIMIQQVMERIVTQTIPEVVINNPAVDWNPFSNEVTAAAVKDEDGPLNVPVKITNAPEPDLRYATLLKTFLASTKIDPYSPTAPTLIARRFDENREIPEERVKALLESVVGSPLVPKIASLIEARLHRPLEPFDIWYNGFQPRRQYTEAQLDEIVRKKYPTADAYKADIPNMLMKLGFTKERAETIAGNIEVDPARGSGHAMGAGMKSAHAHLRTRVEKNGMNYKGFNIAVHEMGHNVEQTLSMNDIDHYLLNGVPNTAFTEAIAFVFQAHDLDLLGCSASDPRGEALKTLNDFWAVYEIAGVALVDMEVWHWMYGHPSATPAQLKDATLHIAKNIWNKYYAPVFKKNDVQLLAIYSHMIDSYMYLPDYPIGHLIAHQIEVQVKKSGSVGKEVERMVKAGSISPDLWMIHATGSPVGSEALLQATELAIKEYRE